MMEKDRKRILVSVTDKRFLEDFKPLQELGWQFISTGGTATKLRELGFTVTDVSEVTGFPEGMDGRIKTLHPKIFGGILADLDVGKHVAFLLEHDLISFDIVAVNLYDFADSPSIEKIDVGGPSMLRAAAKNYKFVTPICDPGDYKMVVEQIQKKGGVSELMKHHLAGKAFRKTANYDNMIATWFNKPLTPSD
jgi:phosphoribosylaminoimidazolecarboxamide formyltransferase/IMP cyclohydrolase